MATKVKFPCIVILEHIRLKSILKAYEVYLESESDDCWYGHDDDHRYGGLTGYPKDQFVITKVIMR
jgi:hypothetical protein